jgi:hypothetical protein
VHCGLCERVGILVTKLGNSAAEKEGTENEPVPSTVVSSHWSGQGGSDNTVPDDAGSCPPTVPPFHKLSRNFAKRESVKKV